MIAVQPLVGVVWVKEQTRRADGEPPALTERHHEIMAPFRKRLRVFLHFSKAGARREGLTPQQQQRLLAVQGARGPAWTSMGSRSDFRQLQRHSAVGPVTRAARMGLVRR